MNLEKLFQRGVDLHNQHLLEEAKETYQKVLSKEPRHAEALYYTGIIHAQLGHPIEAIKLYKKSLAVKPDTSAVHNDLGITLNNLQKHSEALAAFQHAVKADPENVEAYNNLGGVLGYFERSDEAQACFIKALAIMPDHDEANYNLGVVFSDRKQFSTAEQYYNNALKRNPDHFRALTNLGIIKMKQQHLQQACAYFQQALKIEPGHSNTLSQLAICLRQMCSWESFAEIQQSLIQWHQSSQTVPNAFAFLMWSDDPAAQQKCARSYTKSIINNSFNPINALPANDAPRIKVAYLSADFREHPVSYLTAELYELHDRTKFEITAIAYGPPNNSPMRQRLMKAFDHFHEAGHLSDTEVAELIASSGIHIVVDLTGHTHGSRLAVLARRPAPIQINYLGYIGTMGAKFIDYILVDKFSVPAQQQPFFDEQLVHLPCYMVTDSKQKASDKTPSKSSCCLPEKGFVYCCFNNTSKITPTLFSIWMRCLKAVPDSVLWLVDDNEWMRENLRREAKQHNIDPHRLIFAVRIPLPEHLARQRLADLFLDTLPYNAGTTASDALGIGLPVITCPGNSFVSRMSGSLLHAAGLPELAVETLSDYEALAIRLACEPELLKITKAKLIDNRSSAPLFDSQKFCTNFEAALTLMVDKWHDSVKNPSQQMTEKPNLIAMLEDTVALHQKGDIDTAEDGYKKILEKEPENADALHLYGVINAQRGNIDKAIALYHHAIRIDSGLYAAHNNLGIALGSIGEFHQAAESFRHANEISPNDESHHNLGNCHYYLKQYNEAISQYEKALAINPDHANSQRNIKACLKHLEQ
ncbi:TPR domain protein, putative component of TonB system [hydrothermal vent metagenome]|uniref:protein O-GlcNAc transferase n=1 Tax=hydrothermal vent metagenome TaxID=652676 RepID=A0A3B1A3W3_9ZZZZ